jgi:hypothetical protein
MTVAGHAGMIVFLALRTHLYTVQSLCRGDFGPALPTVRGLAYEDVLISETAAAATYIFTDIERLTAWERRLAAELFRALQAAGCRCLNDPARVLTRYPLLRALHRAGINPFRVWRLEDQPVTLARSQHQARPSARDIIRNAFGIQRAGDAFKPRFPIFLRNEADHGKPLSGLLRNPAELDDTVRQLTDDGVPLCGVLGVEYCATPLAPGIWAKFNTFRVGDAMSTDHAVIEDKWCVKEGTASTATPEMLQWEHDHVVANDLAPLVAPAFQLANIEYGRADHSTVNGKEVIYEINTNPFLAPLHKQVSAVRDDAIGVARARYAAALWQLDAGDGSTLTLHLSERANQQRHLSAANGEPFRP